MTVELYPPELGFRRPFTQEVTQLLRLRNPGNDPIAFKVKTTAPKQYCVRPNSGRIEVGSEVEVQVLLQAMREDPPPDAKCRDKFLVQAVPITADREVGNVTQIWQNIEKIAKGQIEERKIRVVFLPPHGTAATPQHNNINGTHLGSEAPPAYGSPAPSYGSPAQEAVTPQARSAAPDTSSLNYGSKSVADSMSSTAASAGSTVGAAASNVSNSIPTSGEDLRAQLEKANAKSAQLTQQLQEQGLRQRKADAVNQDSRERITTGTTGMGIQQQPRDGVPVQIVAGLCLLSFLFAYFLF